MLLVSSALAYSLRCSFPYLTHLTTQHNMPIRGQPPNLCMQGFAYLHQSSQSASGQEAASLTQAAVSSLFQAANVFKAVNEAAHYGQQSHVAASCDLIKHVIQTVLTSLAGSYQEPAQGVR